MQNTFVKLYLCLQLCTAYCFSCNELYWWMKWSFLKNVPCMARSDIRASLGNFTIHKWFYILEAPAPKLKIPPRTIIVGVDINGQGLVQAVTSVWRICCIFVRFKIGILTLFFQENIIFLSFITQRLEMRNRVRNRGSKISDLGFDTRFWKFLYPVPIDTIFYSKFGVKPWWFKFLGTFPLSSFHLLLFSPSFSLQICISPIFYSRMIKDFVFLVSYLPKRYITLCDMNT